MLVIPLIVLTLCSYTIAVPQEPAPVPRDKYDQVPAPTAYYALLRNFYDSVVYPNALDYAADLTKATEFFADNVIGRSARYWGPITGSKKIGTIIWSSSPNKEAPTSDYYFDRIEMRQYVEARRTVAVTIDLYVKATPNGAAKGVQDSAFTQIDWWWFNSDGKIAAWDNSVINIGEYGKMIGADFASRKFQAETIRKSCGLITLVCPSEVTGYTKDNPAKECEQYLGSLEFGTFDTADKNTGICRIIQLTTIFLNGADFCEAMGKIPNSICTDDHTYMSYYEYPFTPRWFIATPPSPPSP